MKNILFLIAGLSAGIIYFVLKTSQSSAAPVPVADLAHKLQDAWADHHTVA